MSADRQLKKSEMKKKKKQMKIDELLKELSLAEDTIDMTSYMPKSDDAARREIAKKALNKVGINNVLQTNFNLTYRQMLDLTDYLYWMGYEDGVNEVE